MRQRPFAVSQELYRFEDHWLERDGAAMHYVDHGSGTPVLLLHGNPTWSFLYRDVIRMLGSGARAIAPDYPGFGFSDHPRDYGYTPPEHAEWVTALIDHLRLPPFVLVVHDWGGPIGMSIATRQPDRIAGIVILNTWAWPPTFDMRVFSHAMGGNTLGKWLQLRRNFFARRILPAGISRADRKTPEILDAYTAPFPDRQSRVGTWVFPGAIRKNYVWLRETENALWRLRDKPVEFVWAMNDVAFAKKHIMARWRGHFPTAPWELIAGAKHYLPEEQPERVAAAIERVIAASPAGPPAPH